MEAKRPGSIDHKILSLMARGFNTKEIAGKLGYEEHTIESYRYKLMRKHKVRNGCELIAYAYENKLLTINEHV